MLNAVRNNPRTGLIAAVALSLAAVVLLSVVAISVRSDAGAADRATKTVVLGSTASTPDPACPDRCLVVASVSGFQAQNPTGSSPFKVPFDGRLTQFRLYLGKPKKSDRMALNERFGAPPQAAIAVLKPIETPTGKEKFELLRKSPVENLNAELGTVATLKLAKPLTVRKGNYAALVVPTWLPAFASGLNPSQNRWRASRQPGKCSAAFIDQASPQVKVGSKRLYSCKFAGERILYTATITNAPVR